MPPQPPNSWIDARDIPPLEQDEVQVWQFGLDVTPQEFESDLALLSPDERARADRYRFERHRMRFVHGRATLRHLLSAWTGVAPGDLRFRYSERGKPGLMSAANLHFNLSHSGDLALLAVTRGNEPGVDIELLRPVRDAGEIARRFFTEREATGIGALAGDDRMRAFFRCWTRKEAWLKSNGTGITGGLNQVEVTFLADEPAAILSIAGDCDAGAAWHVEDLAPAAGYVGALAVESEGRVPRIRRFVWKGPLANTSVRPTVLQ
jgi:4'-phosphopantetheinyl transferase